MSECIEVNGNRFFLRTWGDAGKPTLLMLHGFPEYSGAWEELAGRLKARFYCVAPDQRGYGQSYSPAGVEAYRMHHLVEDLRGIITHLGGPLLVLGHDWGAATAYGLAMAHPDLVSKLIIMNGVHPIPFQRALVEDQDQIAASQYISWLRRDGSETVLAENNFAKLTSMFAQAMDMDWLSGPRLEGYRAAWKNAEGVGTMVNWYRATPLYVPRVDEDNPSMPDMNPEAMRINMPHLLIWGKNDTALLPQSIQGIDDWVEDHTFVALADADHWLHHQQPDKVAAIILNWHYSTRQAAFV